MLNVHSCMFCNFFPIAFRENKNQRKLLQGLGITFLSGRELEEMGRFYFSMKHLSLPEQRRPVSSLRIVVCIQYSMIRRVLEIPQSHVRARPEELVSELCPRRAHATLPEDRPTQEPSVYPLSALP